MPTRSQGAAAAAAKVTPGEVGSSNPQTQSGKYWLSSYLCQGQYHPLEPFQPHTTLIHA